VATIRDVVLFPTMRPRADGAADDDDPPAGDGADAAPPGSS
jgi:hypothetical protein